MLGRKVRLNGGAGLDLLTGAIQKMAANAPRDLTDLAGPLSARAERLAEVTAALWKNGEPRRALANATLYLEAAGHIVIAWMWLSMAASAHGKPGPFYAGKLAAAQYFFRYELPKVDAQLDLLAAGDTLLLELDTMSL